MIKTPRLSPKIYRLVGPVFYVLFVGYLLAGLIAYFHQYPLPDFLLKIISVVTSFIVTGYCLVLGHEALDFASKYFNWNILKSHKNLTITVMSIGLGWGILSTVIFLLGWVFPGPLKIKLWVLTLVLTVLLISRVSRLLVLAKTLIQSIDKNFSRLEILLLGLSAAGVFISFLSCFSPITYYDSLVYHLALPSYYLQSGKIDIVPFNLYSFFPQQVEMIFLLIMSLSASIPPDFIINLIGWIISLATSLLISGWVRENWGRPYHLIALVLWWTSPAILLLSIGGYVDVPLSFFTALAVYSFWKGTSENSHSGWIFLSAFFCSLACATKYTGAMTPAILFLFLSYQVVFKKERKIRTLGLFGAGLFFPFGLWLLRNYLAVRNPFFPFFFDILGGGDVGWTVSSADSYFSLLTEYGHKSHIFFELMASPWMIMTQGLSFGGGMDVLGDFGWGPVLFASLISVVLVPSSQWLAFLLGYATLHFGGWFVSKPVLRFLVSLFPVLVVISSIGIGVHLIGQRPWKKCLAFLLIGPWIASHFFVYFLIASNLKLFDVPLGIQGYDGFLDKRLAYHSAYKFLEEKFGEFDRLLIIGEQRTYSLKIPFLASNLFAPSPMARFSNGGEMEIRDWLNQEKITHILIHHKELIRLGGWEKFGFSGDGERNFKNVLKSRGTLIFDEHSVQVFQIHNN